jgi:outer membrane lipoprotein-sorting protein
MMIARNAFFLALAASLSAEPLEDILARMDKAAKEFQSYSARIKRVDYTAVINESNESSGSIRLRRTKAGADGIVEFTEPDPRVIHVSGRTFEIYYPKANTVEIYDAGKRANALEQFFLLGFGTTGVDLRKGYDIKLVGTEAVGAAKTTRIELTPKTEDVRKYVTRIDLWIPEGASNPVQEKVTQPSKDYSIATFTDLKVNSPLPDSAFELKTPAGVKKIRP